MVAEAEAGAASQVVEIVGPAPGYEAVNAPSMPRNSLPAMEGCH